MKPKLRFKEFDEDWEEKRLGDVAEIIMGQSPNSESYNGEYCGIPLIQGNADIRNYLTIDRIYTTRPTKIVKRNQLLMTVRAPVGELGFTHTNCCIGRGVCCIKSKNDLFLFQFLTSKRNLWKTFSQGSTFEAVNSTDIKAFKINLPSLPEQEKIGQFFSLLDDRIEKQEQKINLLKERKKGWMQKLFNQEIRFKDENGDDYPDWEEKKLGDIGDTYNGLSGKTKDDFGHGEAKFITFVNVLNHTIAKQSGVDCIEVDSKQNEVKYGDFLFTTSSETPEEVGMSSLWLNQESNIYLNSFCFGYRLKESKNISYIYMAYLLRSASVRTQFIKLAQGISRYNISKKKVMDIIISLPSFSEQEKIANFLSVQDELIEQEEKKLNLLKEQKKGLLQQMFV